MTRLQEAQDFGRGDTDRRSRRRRDRDRALPNGPIDRARAHAEHPRGLGGRQERCSVRLSLCLGLRSRPLGELALESLRGVGYLATRGAFDLQQLVERGAQVPDLVFHALSRKLSPEQRRGERSISEQQQPQAELCLSKRLVDVSSGTPRAGRIRRNPALAIRRLSRFELPDSVTTSAKRTATPRGGRLHQQV